MNYADFGTAPDGFPLESDATLGFMQSSYLNALRALAKMSGDDDVIVSGLDVVGGVATDGYILKDGDLVYFQGGTVQATYVIETTAQEKANENGVLYDRYFTKKARFGSGSGQHTFADLVRAETLVKQIEIIRETFGDNTVINGCESTVAGATVTITAGAAFIDGLYVEAGSYSGSFPVYLKPDGTYTATEPASGSYITFDPYTKDRIEYSYRRKMTPVGTIQMFAGDLDMFDGSGLGKWGWNGWALCNGSNGTVDMRGFFPVGYDPRTTDPGGGVWDANYKNVGATGGEKQHTLTIDEMPSHQHTGSSIANGEAGLIRKADTGENRTNAASDVTPGEPDVITSPAPIPAQGGGQAHENRPPYRVLLFVQRI